MEEVRQEDLIAFGATQNMYTLLAHDKRKKSKKKKLNIIPPLGTIATSLSAQQEAPGAKSGHCPEVFSKRELFLC